MRIWTDISQYEQFYTYYTKWKLKIFGLNIDFNRIFSWSVCNLEYIEGTKEKETIKNDFDILERKLKDINKLQNEELQSNNLQLDEYRMSMTDDFEKNI